MFSRRKTKPPAIALSQLASLVAEGVEIRGDVHFDRGMRIDGCVKGNVVGRGGDGGARSLLVLSGTGRIEGSVRCGDAMINGSVEGDLEVEHFLELQSAARISGTIRYRQLRMDVGAEVSGRLQRVDAAADDGKVVALEAPSPARLEHG